MTRKCVICKETNYKNGSSFFSAPKDPEIRKLWQDAIGIENYVVKDDTYVCSKHFYSTDIITHWFSGVPPHVITVKYKKFRLRPGAIPKIEIDPNDEDLEYLECESELEVNRSSSPVSDPLSSALNTTEEIFSIPRKNLKENESEHHRDMEDMEFQNSFEDDIPTFSSEHKSQKTHCEKNYNPKDNTSFLEEEEINSIDLNRLRKKQEPLDIDDSTFKSSNLNNETMLFEDLLEICTEVSLPRGWSSFVISKGHGTTILYSFTKINKSGMPVVEKQVFVKNNMILRCSVRNRNVDPMIHNLIKDNRNLKVKTLMDVEELIDEFDKRQICDGNPVRNLLNIEAFYEGTNWRHTSCSLIINNGLSICSKCASLNSRKRKSTSIENTYSVSKSRFIERQNKMKSIEKSINEQVKSNCDDRLSSLPPKTISLLSDAVDLLRIPKIQKLMIKECFKFQTHGDENVADFSRSWIFLCLLLYVESPKMYKYMFLNKYMNLPPLRIVRTYVNRIKTDPEFYNIFQKCIQQFQSFTEEVKAGKPK